METKQLLPTPEGIDEAAHLLQEGQLVAIPTETVYGLAANALDPAAVASIFTAKERPMDNPLIVHIADMDDWAPLVTHIPDNARRLAEAYWPGPLTIILPAAECVPDEVRGGLSTVAVRFPSHPVAQAVILHAGCPLAAPSANRSGAPSPTNATRVTEDMQGRIAAVLDGGESAVGVESTVVDLCHTPPRLLRPGGITPAMLEEVLGTIEIDDAVTHTLKAGAVAASPGMKYKHYAPQARIRLVKGGAKSYVHYVNSHAGEGVVALCFEEELSSLTVPALSYGHRDDPLEQAHRLFDALRQLDEMGAKVVYAAAPCPRGVGLAVYNRLIRAAGFDVINAIRVIGLTGPTGAGKSTVADAWRQAGAAIIDADKAARAVTAPGSPCLAKLEEAFSPAILTPEGTLNRQELARRAFSSPENTALLNSITHPAIIDTMTAWLEAAAEEGHDAAVLDAPLLYEAGADRLCHHIVTVTANADHRLARIMARDGLSEEAARQRMNAQKPDSFYCREGVTILHNNGDESALQQQAAALWQHQDGWWSTE